MKNGHHYSASGGIVFECQSDRLFYCRNIRARIKRIEQAYQTGYINQLINWEI